MKWAEGSLISKRNNHFFATIDSFEGNSGSPVFDSQGRLIGLLIGGEEDFKKRKEESCRSSYQCQRAGDCSGEEVISIEQIEKEFKRLN
jgi:V8-like Glu-specific endopeptidase